MEIRPVFHSHPTETMWEEYSFGRSDDQEAAALEEHLLLCEACQNSLEELTEHIRLMKAATARLEPPPHRRLARGWGLVKQASAQPLGRLFWITGLAAVCLPLWFSVGSVPSKAPSLVNLASFRGEDASITHAPARRPLDLSINSSDVPAPEYRMTVVTSSGKQVWAGSPKVSGSMLSVRIPQGLESGAYWVRLYSRESVILSEYGLRLE